MNVSELREALEGMRDQTHVILEVAVAGERHFNVLATVEQVSHKTVVLSTETSAPSLTDVRPRVSHRR